MADFQGLAFRFPALGGIFTVMLLSLAGIPLTVGFMGKFYIVTAGMRGGLWWLVLTLLVTSGVSLFYYLRIVVILFSRPGEGQEGVAALPGMGLSDGLVLATMAVLLVWLGIGPGLLLGLIHGLGG
jgi:NADH-quinone oxidoreductase subunit N